jgi:hypothetical protein
MRKRECKMGGRRKHTIEEVKEFLKPFNYILLEKDYINQLQKLHMICDKGHECFISFKCFKNNTRCKICSNVNRGLKQRTPFDEIKKFIESCGCILLSTEDDYINSYSKLLLTCKHGHDFESSIQSLKATNCGCPICRNTNNGINLRKDGNIVVQDFINKGLIPKFESKDYINAKQKLPYLCPHHLYEGIKFANHNDVLHAKFVCKSCYLENNQGENHWNWHGGISSLSEYLRVRLNDWKFESLKVYDFKCAITGIHSRDLEIHHLYNFSGIVNETLEILNLPIKKVKDYTIEELSNIEKTFNEIHRKYGLGIPLHKDIHKLFHKIYGNKNNTPEQFEEFKRNYINNKYKEV